MSHGACRALRRRANAPQRKSTTRRTWPPEAVVVEGEALSLSCPPRACQLSIAHAAEYQMPRQYRARWSVPRVSAARRMPVLSTIRAVRAGHRPAAGVAVHDAPRTEMQETTNSGHFAPGMRFLGLDFGVQEVRAGQGGASRGQGSTAVDE
eukprot:3584674-Rhodomonas_salina.1